MSKRKAARKKKRRKAAAAARNSPDGLLSALAAALNACEQAGLKPRFVYGCVYSSHGVVLSPDRKHGWRARGFRDLGGGALPGDDLDD